MLLKVSDGIGGWVLIDNVDQAHLLPKWHTVQNATELVTVGGDGALNLISKDCFGKGITIHVGIIEFIRSEATRKLLFTDIVYICNDNGDTLDKMSAARRPEKRR